MDVITQILNGLNTFLYSKILIVLLVFTGVYFTVRTKGAVSSAAGGDSRSGGAQA